MHEPTSIKGDTKPPAVTGGLHAPAAGDLRRAVTRGAAAAAVLRASGMGVALIVGIVLTRALGPAGYGTYSWAFALAAAIAVPAALGADQLLVREAGVTLARGQWDSLRALVRSALGRVAFASVGLAALAAAGLALAGGGLGMRRSALLVALPIIPLAAVGAVAQATLLGLGKTGAALAPGTLARQAAFLVFVGLAALVGGLSPSGAVALQLAATGTASIAVLVLLRRALVRAPRSSGPPRAVPREWLRTSVPMGAATMLLVVDAQVGLLVLGAAGSAADAGVYAAATLCTAPFTLLLAAGRYPLGGAVARLSASGDRARLQRGLRTATRAVAGISAVVAVVLLLVPTAILGAFGSGFSAGTPALRILVVAQLINAMCAFNGLVLLMGGEERAAMRAALGCLVLDTSLCIVLVPPLGARGAAFAVLISVTMRNALYSTIARRRLGIDTTVIGRPLRTG